MNIYQLITNQQKINYYARLLSAIEKMHLVSYPECSKDLQVVKKLAFRQYFYKTQYMFLCFLPIYTFSS